MKQFLVESWQLWYGSLFCPSRVPERLRSWTTRFGQNDQRRQYLFVTLLFCLPLALLCIRQDRAEDLWLVASAWLAAYSLGGWKLSFGLHLPLFFALVYAQQPLIFAETATQTSTSLPDWWPQYSLGLSVYLPGMAASVFAADWLKQRRRPRLAQVVQRCGCWLSTTGAAWIATNNLFLTAILGGVAGIMTFLQTIGQHPSIDDDPDLIPASMMLGAMLGVASGPLLVLWPDFLFVPIGLIGTCMISCIGLGAALDIVLGIEFGFRLGIAASAGMGAALMVMFSIAGGLAGLAQLPASSVVLIAGLAGLCLGWPRFRWPLIGGLAASFVILDGARLGLEAWLAAGMALLTGSRLLPFYPVWCLLSIAGGRGESRLGPATENPLLHSRLPRRANDGQALPADEGGQKTLNKLKSLPPYSDELIWLPMPGHDRLLSEAFRQAPDDALNILQTLRAAPMPGFHVTIGRALGQIVADRLADVDSLSDLALVASLQHPYLPQLAPEVYTSATDTGETRRLRLWSRPQPTGSALRAVLRIFLGLGSDVQAALQVTSLGLRQRSLERVLAELRTRQGQLPGLGLRQAEVQRWLPVFAQWAGVLEKEIAACQSPDELINPFQSGNPLRPERAYLFKGRTRLAEQLLRLALARGRPTVALHGPRRMGKTSFLLNLPRLLPSDILPVYFDLQNEAATQSESDFCYGLVRAMRRDARAQGVNLPEAQRAEFMISPYTALEDWLDLALPSLGKRRILLNLDEFEALGAALEAGRLSERLFNHLRHLVQHYDALAFIFSGVATLEELGPQWSDYFINVTALEISYLEADEARQLLTDPDPEFGLCYAPGVVEQVMELTHNHPLLLQLLGGALVEQATQQGVRQADAALLEKAIASALVAGESLYFRNLWDQATGKTPDEAAGGRAILRALAAGEAVTATEAASQAALRRLLQRHVIERVEGGYGIEVPLVGLWLRQRAPEE